MLLCITMPALPTSGASNGMLALTTLTISRHVDLFHSRPHHRTPGAAPADPPGRPRAVRRLLRPGRGALLERRALDRHLVCRNRDRVNLHHFFNQNNRCELGYALGSPHWGRGYATEAIAAALEHGFHAAKLNRIEADIDPRNSASARVLEKLGFRKEGYMPQRWLVHGQYADTVNYGLLRSYWEERAAQGGPA